jgi:hypothetical protein
MDPHRAEGAVKRRATGQAPRGHRRSNPLRRSEERHRGETGVMPSVRRCRRARPPSARAPRSPAPARAFPRRDRAGDRGRARRGERRNAAARAPAVGTALGSRPFRVVSPRAVCRLAFTQAARTPIESPRDPMGEHASRRIRVVDQQCQRSRFFGNVCPAKRWRDIVTVTGVPARDRVRVLEDAALEGQRGHQQVRWSGAAVLQRATRTPKGAGQALA